MDERPRSGNRLSGSPARAMRPCRPTLRSAYARGWARRARGRAIAVPHRPLSAPLEGHDDRPTPAVLPGQPAGLRHRDGDRAARLDHLHAVRPGVVVRPGPGPEPGLHVAGARGRRAEHARPLLRGRLLRAPIAPAARAGRVHPREARAPRHPVDLRGHLPGPARHLHDLRLARQPDGLPGVLDLRLLGADVPAGGLLVPGRPHGPLPAAGLGLRGQHPPAGQRAARGAAARAPASWPSSP